MKHFKSTIRIKRGRGGINIFCSVINVMNSYKEFITFNGQSTVFQLSALKGGEGNSGNYTVFISMAERSDGCGRNREEKEAGER